GRGARDAIMECPAPRVCVVDDRHGNGSIRDAWTLGYPCRGLGIRPVLPTVHPYPRRAGGSGVWAGSAVAVTVWIYQSGLDVLSPILVLCLGLNTLLVLPFLVDRLIAARLAGATGLLATLVFPASRTVAEYLVATFS